MDHKEKLMALVPNGDGYNSEYANTLVGAAEYIRVLEGRLGLEERPEFELDEEAVLKPCPLCLSEHVGHEACHDRKHHMVKCFSCGCRVSSLYSGCVELWNNRPGDK